MTLSFLWNWFFPVSAWMLALGWCWQLLGWLWRASEIIDITRIPEGDLPELPDALRHVTVVVPACNEAASIEATLRSLLASEGVRLQIVAVDDRSMDATGAIMDLVAIQVAGPVAGLAGGEISRHTLDVLHITELPRGWMGKPHALAIAAERAEAEWILFTDGDVVFAPKALELALRYTLAERADHLVLMPDWITKSHGEAAMHGAMHALSTWTLRLWRVADPKARDFLGVGAFNLVRREIYEALGGFGALRMEVLEDLRLGWMVKRAGYRQRVALGHGEVAGQAGGQGLVAVRWAHGAWGVVRNLEKNLFALYRYNTVVALLASGGLAVQIAWPLIGLMGVWGGGWARVAGLVTSAAIAGLYVVSRRVTRVPVGYVVVYPVAAGLFLFAMLRSMVLALWRGGIVWRGTLYSLRELRENAGRFW